MASTGLNGEPILIMGLSDVRILKTLLDTTETSDQDRVMSRIFQFLKDPDCLAWEAEHAED